MTDIDSESRRAAAAVVVLTLLVGAGMTVGFAGGSVTLDQHNASGDAGENGTETPTGEQGHEAKNVTAEGVEIGEVRFENLRVSGLTVDLGVLRDNGTEAAVEDALQRSMGVEVVGLEVECVNFGNITTADITVEDNIATVDAEIESVTLKGISAERVTLGPDAQGTDANGTTDAGTRSDVVGGMMDDGTLDADRVVVENVSIDRVVVERVDEGPDETPTETPDDDVTETPTETPEETPTETPTDTPTETPTGTPTDNVTETPADNETETPADNDSDVPVFEPPGNDTETPTDNETETPTDNETETPTDNETMDGAERSASVQFEDQTSNGTYVSVAEVNTSDGGFVTIHDASLLEGNVIGSVVGVSEYLEPGEHENVSVALYNVSGAEFNETELQEDQTLIAMPHQDTNDNQSYDFVAVGGEADGPYTEDGEPVTDAANVTVEADGNETVDGNETDAEPTASVRFDDQTSNGTYVSVAEVNTSDGGFVTIHDASLLEGAVFDSVVGVSEYLEPGEHENVSVELFNVSGADHDRTELEEDQLLIAMPHLDSNDNEQYDFLTSEGEADGPYFEDDEAIVDAANVTVAADGNDTVDGNETMDGNETADGNETMDGNETNASYGNETNSSAALGLVR